MWSTLSGRWYIGGQMKEFGYEVSKDYEKLRKMFAEAKERVAVFGYSDNYQNCIRDRVIIDNINDFDYGDNRVCMMSVDNHGSDDLYFLDLDELVSRCIELQVTFIDPNPPNPYAILYADGSEVSHGDNIKIISTINNNIQSYFGRKIVNIILWIQNGCHFINLELYCKYKKNVYHTIYLTTDLIKWDNNRTTNVKKVVV